VVQVAGNVPLSVAALSYAGQLNIGIQSDPDGLPTWTSSPTAYAGRWRSWARPRVPPGLSRADRPTIEQCGGRGSAWPCWPTRSRAWRRGPALAVGIAAAVVLFALHLLYQPGVLG
jgi:hypothetical protein